MWDVLIDHMRRSHADSVALFFTFVIFPLLFCLLIGLGIFVCEILSFIMKGRWL